MNMNLNTQPHQYLNPTHWKTANNIPVYFLPSQCKNITDIDILISGGIHHDGEKIGLNYFCNQLLTHGSQQFSEEEILIAQDAIGASISEYAGFDYSTLSLRVMSEASCLYPAIKLFTDAFTNPIFSSTSIKQIKQKLHNLLQMHQQSAGYIANQHLKKHLFEGHPYAHLKHGDAKQIDAISRSDILAFHKSHYLNTNNLCIALISDISISEAKDIAEKIAKEITPSPSPLIDKLNKPLLPFPKTTIPTYLHHPFKNQQSTILLGRNGIPKKHPDFFALSIANQILGGGGLNSLLFNEIRKKNGLAYDVHSSLATLQAGGIIKISATTQVENTENTIKLIQQQMNSFHKHPQLSTWITHCKQYLINSFPLDTVTNTDRLNQLVTLIQYDYPLDYLDHYASNIQNTSNQHILDCIEQYFNSETFSCITVGSQKLIANPLITL